MLLTAFLNHCLVALRQKRLMQLLDLQRVTAVQVFLPGYLLTYDALKMEFRKVKLPQDTKGCAVCGEHPTITELIDYEQAECDGVHL